MLLCSRCLELLIEEDDHFKHKDVELETFHLPTLVMADAKDLVSGFGREVGTDLARALGDPQRVLQARVESLLQLNKLSEAKKEGLPGDDPEKLEAVTKKMKVFRLEAQDLQKNPLLSLL